MRQKGFREEEKLYMSTEKFLDTEEKDQRVNAEHGGNGERILQIAGEKRSLIVIIISRGTSPFLGFGRFPTELTLAGAAQTVDAPVPLTLPVCVPVMPTRRKNTRKFTQQQEKIKMTRVT